jgi:predicted cupin superfamily sugar epimerase
MKYSIDKLVIDLNLTPHPEGGFYREIFRSEGIFPVSDDSAFPSGRNYSTAIYFLLTDGNFSALHRIRSDETWHYYNGDPTLVVEITPEGKLIQTVLGPYIDQGQVFQYTVKAGHWFGSMVANNGTYSLTGCTVAPGFDFRDFEMADRHQITKEFIEHADLIRRFTRE